MTNRNIRQGQPIDVPIIGGSGGGKSGGGRAAVEAPSSLRSKQIAHVVDLLGEGEWEGLVNGPGGIFLNDVPLFTLSSPTNDVIDFTQISDQGSGLAGVWNFKGVSVEFREGSQGQSAIKTLSTASSSQLVNQQVLLGSDVIVAVSETEFDIAVVTVQVDALYQQNPNNGDISGWYVDFRIEARQSGGSWVHIFSPRIDGKSMGPYAKDYAFDLTAVNPVGPWEIKVSRLSPNDSVTKHSTLRFLSLGLRTSEKFRYPNSVLCAISFDASQLSSIPRRAFDVKMTRVRVPSNYNAATRVYTGVWDGTFQIAWTDNPAWCLFEMATNPRFGLGEYFDETLLDKWTLYTIAQYCDQLVPDGFGGTEPRFTINAYFQSGEDAITVIQNMASVFRGIIYYMGGGLVAVQDAPSDPTYAFNNTNVVDGKFSYAGASGSVRHTVAMVVWNNPEIGYQQDIEYVEDPEGLVKFGYRPVTVAALGCTSRGQAHRLGLWTLYVEQYESDVVTFATGVEGTGVAPGQIVEIYDESRAGVRLGGRVLDVIGSVMTADKGVTLPVGTHTVSYIGVDGSLLTRTTTIASPGTFTTLTLDGADPMVGIGSLFGVQTSSVLPQLFRILSIAEQDMKHEINAVSHRPDKYAYIENNLTLQSRPISAINTVLEAVTGLTFTETLYLLGDESVGIRLSVSWEQNSLAMGYLVSWRRGASNWTVEKLYPANEFTINPVAEGLPYGVRITPVSILGTKGQLLETEYTVLGEKAPPPPFDYFTCTVQPDGTRQFDFGYTVTEKPIDFKGARIRYAVGVTADWDSMVPLENEGFYPFSPFETNQLLSGSYTIAAKAEDRTKNLSTPVFIQVTLPDRRLGNVLVEYNEADEGWTGTKSSCHLDPINNWIEADDSTTWSGLPSTWDAWLRWNTTPASPITYTGPVRDLVSLLAVLLEVNLNVDGSAVTEVRYSNDNVTFSSWLPASTPFTARYFQVRVTVTATGGEPVPVIRGFVYQVGGKVKKESINDLNIAALTGAHRIGTGDIRVPISNTYTVISRVTVMAIQDANPGWSWLLVDRDVTTGPHLRFYKNGVLADPSLVDIYIEGY